MKSFTKRMSILVALILCVTIGGVYATWMYAADAGLSEVSNKAVSLAPVEQEGTIGAYEILFEDFRFVIDQTAVGDYTPKLTIHIANGNGDLKIKFTPNTVASDEVKENGIVSHLKFSSTLSHQGVDDASPIELFKFPKNGGILDIGTANSDETYKWVSQGNGSFICTIPHADLSTWIQLNYTTKLDTIAKFNAFSTSLGSGNVIFTVYNDYAGASAAESTP